MEVTGYLTYDKYTPTWAEDKDKKITSAKIVASKCNQCLINFKETLTYIVNLQKN